MQNMQGIQQPSQPHSNPSKGSSAADLHDVPQHQSIDAQLSAQQTRQRLSISPRAAQPLPSQPSQEGSHRPLNADASKPRMSMSGSPAQHPATASEGQSMPRRSLSATAATQPRQSVHADRSASRQSITGRQQAADASAEPRLSVSRPTDESRSAWQTFAHEMPAQPYSPRPGVSPPVASQARPGSAAQDPSSPSMLARRSFFMQDNAGPNHHPFDQSHAIQQEPGLPQPRGSFKLDSSCSGQQPARVSLMQQQENGQPPPRASFKQDSAAWNQQPARMSMASKQEASAPQPRMSSFKQGVSDTAGASHDEGPSRCSSRMSLQQDETERAVVAEPSLAAQMQPRLSLRSAAPDADMQQYGRQSDQGDFVRSGQAPQRVSMTSGSVALPNPMSPGTAFPQAPQYASSASASQDSPRSLEHNQPRQSFRPVSQSGFGSEVTTTSLQPEGSRRGSAFLSRTSIAAPAASNQECQMSPDIMAQQPGDQQPPGESIAQRPSSQRSSSRSALEDLPQPSTIQQQPSSPSAFQPVRSHRPSAGPTGMEDAGTVSDGRMSGYDMGQLGLARHQASPRASIRPQFPARAMTMQEHSTHPEPARTYRRSQSDRNQSTSPGTPCRAGDWQWAVMGTGLHCSPTGAAAAAASYDDRKPS